MEACVFAVTQGVRQRARRVAHPHGDAARGLDLGNGVIGLCKSKASRSGQHSQGDELFFRGELLG